MDVVAGCQSSFRWAAAAGDGAVADLVAAAEALVVSVEEAASLVAAEGRRGEHQLRAPFALYRIH